MTRPYRTLAVESAKHVAIITLNRPEKKNALGPEMVSELIWALDDAKDARDVRVIVLRGAGPAFCAGADLRGLGSDFALPSKGDFADLLLRLATLGKPTVARVHGAALGGGLGLVAASDFAIAGRSATFGTPEIHRGLFPMMIMAVLRRVTSKRRLFELMLLGEVLDAGTAERMELVSRVVDDAALDAELASLVDKLASRSPTAMRLGLEAYQAQSERDLATALPDLRDRLFAMLGTDDAQEGVRAFLEKRPAIWKD